MSAPVIAFDSIDASPTHREERLKRKMYEASQAVSDALQALKLMSDVHDCRTPMGQLVTDAWRAEHDYHSCLERRIRQHERTLRAALASDTVPDEQRSRILEILHGKRGVGRDPKTLSKSEGLMIEQYRAMDAPARQMIRTLFERLTATPNDKGERSSATSK